MLLIGLCAYAILVYSGALQGRFRGEVFSYFTILSVLLALAYFSALVITSQGKHAAADNVGAGLAPALAHFKGGVTLAVTITMTVYHFLLAPMIFEMVGYQPFTANDIIVHYAIPLMVILDWLRWTALRDIPADCNPTLVYLAGLGRPAAMRTMRQALAVSAAILTNGVMCSPIPAPSRVT